MALKGKPGDYVWHVTHTHIIALFVEGTAMYPNRNPNWADLSKLKALPNGEPSRKRGPTFCFCGGDGGLHQQKTDTPM